MKTLKSISSLLLLFIGVILANAQNMNRSMAMPMTASDSKVHKAVCVLQPTQGNSVSGTIIFTKTETGVKVVADLQGLSKGKHGIHIHECGDCTAADGISAGGHFRRRTQVLAEGLAWARDRSPRPDPEG